jgi:hypothetical protein
MLSDIFKNFGITLLNSNGELRSLVDVLEDMYLKLNTEQFVKLMNEIRKAELASNLFDEMRGRKYLEV